jgi:hypothetical protein
MDSNKTAFIHKYAEEVIYRKQTTGRSLFCQSLDARQWLLQSPHPTGKEEGKALDFGEVSCKSFHAHSGSGSMPNKLS